MFVSKEDDQDIEELANANAGWVFVFSEPDVNFRELNFTGQSGWRADVSAESLKTIGEYCDQFLTPELCAKMAEWSNARAGILKMEDENFEFRDITEREMRSFLGATLLMGIIRKPYIRQYWDTQNFILTPIFSQIMGRDRYSNILRFLRFSDPTQPDARAKTKRLSDYDIIASHVCQKYTPEMEQSLDESLLSFKGRLNFKQFIRIKRARFGIKIFILCDIHGYNMISYATYFAKQPILSVKRMTLAIFPKARRLWLCCCHALASWTKAMLSLSTIGIAASGWQSTSLPGTLVSVER